MKAVRFLIAVHIGLSVASLSSSSARAAQTSYSDLFTMSGKVVAKGTNTNPIGPNGVKTFNQTTSGALLISDIAFAR